jgi:hypothetical protein
VPLLSMLAIDIIFLKLIIGTWYKFKILIMKTSMYVFFHVIAPTSIRGLLKSKNVDGLYGVDARWSGSLCNIVTFSWAPFVQMCMVINISIDTIIGN